MANVHAYEVCKIVSFIIFVCFISLSLSLNTFLFFQFELEIQEMIMKSIICGV